MQVGPDLIDQAVRWALKQPELQELMYNSYLTPDTCTNARRFYRSEEFKETVDILASLGKGPQHGLRLLDAGAGNGVASYAFARMGYKVVAVDSSPSEIAGIGAAKKLQGVDGVQFDALLADLMDVELPAESFDVVYARQVLHHARDLQGMVARLAYFLKPGGVLCALREHVIWSEEQRERFLRSHPLNHITQSEGAFYLKEYRAAFRNAGLKLLIELHPYESIINVYPRSLKDVREQIKKRLPRLLQPVLKIKQVDQLALYFLSRYTARKRDQQLYSFFARKAHCPQATMRKCWRR